VQDDLPRGGAGRSATPCESDERVFLMGEDVGRYGGAFACSRGLLEEFGPERVRDTPLSESAFVGAGIGAALGGMRPIVEVMTVNFSLLALDQIVNNAATLRHMSGGQFSVPLVIRMATGGGRQLAAQHSHSLEGWYAHVPASRSSRRRPWPTPAGMLWPACATRTRSSSSSMRCSTRSRATSTSRGPPTWRARRSPRGAATWR
jgi:pyruvate dehydrogenase E1 component beta subunit